MFLKKDDFCKKSVKIRKNSDPENLLREKELIKREINKRFNSIEDFPRICKYL